MTLYRHHREEGLKSRPRGKPNAKLPEPVREKILELKREEPSRGIKRIFLEQTRMDYVRTRPDTKNVITHSYRLQPK